MRMSIGENIQTLINHWYAYGALMHAQHNNTKTDVRSLPYRVALRCEMGFFGFQQEMGRGSKWDTRGTQWYKVNVEGCSTRFMQYKGRTRLWEAYKVMGKKKCGQKSCIILCEINTYTWNFTTPRVKDQCTHVLLTI